VPTALVHSFAKKKLQERNSPMGNRVEGKVAFVTGAARGQGRSHAITLAEEGAAIIAIDSCGARIDTVEYPLPTQADLAETVELVKQAGGRILASVVDVRDLAGLQQAVTAGVAEFGRLDIVVANAGIVNGVAEMWDLTEKQFTDQVDVNLTGVWRTIKASVPVLLQQNQGGSVILTSSTSGLAAELNLGHYVAAKHGVTGLMRNLSAELAPHGIRVNTVNPTICNTPMVNNTSMIQLFTGNMEGATYKDAWQAMSTIQSLNIPFVEPIDISKAVLYLASEDARYVTGTSTVVDGGSLNPFKIPTELPS
jgi:SDR family mycofactocin-dependent oxidoreductase